MARHSQIYNSGFSWVILKFSKALSLLQTIGCRHSYYVAARSNLSLMSITHIVNHNILYHILGFPTTIVSVTVGKAWNLPITSLYLYLKTYKMQLQLLLTSISISFWNIQVAWGVIVPKNIVLADVETRENIELKRRNL